MSRYAVGCAGQHAMHDDSGGASPLHLTTDDVDEAFAACETGPVGCEVYDRKERAWIGPLCREEIDDAKAMITARTTYLGQPCSRSRRRAGRRLGLAQYVVATGASLN